MANIKKSKREESKLVRKINIATEVRKVLKGKQSKLDMESLVHMIGPCFLEVVKMNKEDAEEQKDVDELERMFRLEDPRS